MLHRGPARLSSVIRVEVLMIMIRNLSLRTATASFLALILTIYPTLLNAQQATTDEPSITIRANTRLVEVDVVVVDKAGQAVTGLKPEDFTLEENGKKQKISLFVPPGVANQTSAAPLPPGILSN